MQRLGRDNVDFNPTIAEMITDLETNPKRYPKKDGKLAGYRAYTLRYRRDAWRAVYSVDEAARTVNIIALADHDSAYEQAKRRA